MMSIKIFGIVLNKFNLNRLNCHACSLHATIYTFLSETFHLVNICHLFPISFWSAPIMFFASDF